MTRTLRLTAAAIGAALLWPAAAQAVDPLADTRPCVADREANSGVTTSMSRLDVETRWEVRGQGRVEYVFGERVVTYRWCEHGPRTRAWVGVIYGPNGALGVVWRLPDKEPPTDPTAETSCPECFVVNPRR